MASTLTLNIPDYLQWRDIKKAPRPHIQFTTSPNTESGLHPLIVMVEVPKLIGKHEFSFVAHGLDTMTADLGHNDEKALVDWLTKAGIKFKTS